MKEKGEIKGEVNFIFDLSLTPGAGYLSPRCFFRYVGRNLKRGGVPYMKHKDASVLQKGRSQGRSCSLNLEQFALSCPWVAAFDLMAANLTQ